ncbi:hypothetical protein DRQ26_05400 [bacterium]|nr:MAG: hypothetical protein DRQ26_05400 [bacterium]
MDGVDEASPYSSTWTGGSVHQVVAFDTISGAAGERFVFIGWSDGDTLSNRQILVSSDTNLVANYIRQVAAGIFNDENYGSPAPVVGTYWLSADDTLFASAGSPDDENRKYCTGFIGAGTIADGTTDTLSIAPSGAGAIFWQWNELLPLYISSPYGHPAPAGTVWCAPGEIVEASVESTIYTGSDSRHICVGWNGTGGISPADGNSNYASITITDTASLSWQWLDQYLLTVSAIGCGDAIPSTLGDGWYFADSTADISAGGEVVSSDATHYFFDIWTSCPSGAPFGDENSPATSITMDNPYSTLANYERGARLVVKKSPYHSQGWIFIDGGTYTDVGSLFVWRRTGDTVQAAVSTIDTISDGDSAYIFTGWNVGGTDTISLPITSDIGAVANYLPAYRSIITKIPAETLGVLSIDDSAYTHQSRYDDYWLSGSSHNISVSVDDYISSDRRWKFVGWGDGFSSPSRSITITSPESLSAMYLKQFAIAVAKNPAEDYGSITIDGNVFYGDSALFWAFEDSTVNIAVSGHDVAWYCSLYTFINWADGPADSQRVVMADTSHSFTANYAGDTVLLSINLSSNAWNIPDTMWLDQTATMSSGDEIVITNNSTLPVQFGLMLSDGGGFSWGYLSGADKFVLRAQFDDSAVPPAFSPSRDFVRGTLLWASENIFGTGGENVPAGDTENLWLQFVSPTSLSADGDYTLKLTLWARIRLP